MAELERERDQEEGMRSEDEMASEDDMTVIPNTERRSRRLLAAPLLLGVLAGLALCGLGYLALTLLSPRQPDIQPAARAICADLTGQRYDQLYALLDPALQAQGTQAQFVASQRELDQLQGPVTSCAIASSSASSASGSVTFTLTRSGSPQPTSAQVSLTTDGASWRITAYTGAF
jgi:hypothetical protein